MKNWIIAVLLIFSASASAQKKVEKAVIKTNIYCDHCKACETCGKLFQQNLYDLKGLKMYELDEESATITVYYSPKRTSLEAIRTRISSLGYDADEVKADPKAYDKLDGCCKKAS